MHLIILFHSLLFIRSYFLSSFLCSFRYILLIHLWFLSVPTGSRLKIQKYTKITMFIHSQWLNQQSKTDNVPKSLVPEVTDIKIQKTSKEKSLYCKKDQWRYAYTFLF